jgi:hypothetical protein
VTQKPPSHRLAAAALAALLTTALAALAAASSTAATPCAQAVLADWQDDSRIDRVYDLPCYGDAIDAIPDDLRDYTDAADVIAQAFQRATGRELDVRTPQGRQTEIPHPATAPSVNASSPSSVPVPLLVLAAMSLVLLAAGGLGYVARRRQGPAGDD